MKEQEKALESETRSILRHDIEVLAKHYISDEESTSPYLERVFASF